MSNRSLAPDDAASNLAVTQHFPSPQHLRAASKSLLTQALADECKTSPESERLESRATAGPYQWDISAEETKSRGHDAPPPPPGPGGRRGHVKAPKSYTNGQTVAGYNSNFGNSTDSEESTTGSRAYSRRRFWAGSRGRGTSLERTERERRVQDAYKGTYSINPGDTGMPTISLPRDQRAELIVETPPVQGVRGRYRSWRDSSSSSQHIEHLRQDENDHAEIQKSIAEARSSGEPNTRSRKASHSMRFFREGDKTKTWEARTRDKTQCGPEPISINDSAKKSAREDADDTPSRGQTPSDTRATEKREAARSSFHNEIREHEEHQAHLPLPTQLLQEIRAQHNLTPGAGKGSSFSRSIPVTASERKHPREYEEHHEVTRYDNSKSPTTERDRSQSPSPSETRHDEDGDESCEEHDSGEEQMTSALFVPHHRVPGGKGDETQASKSEHEEPHRGLSATEQWLERTEVAPNDVELIVGTPGNDGDVRPLTSGEARRLGAIVELDTNLPVRSSEAGSTSQGNETETEDTDTTPTGSLKLSPVKQLQEKRETLPIQQQEPKQPLAAIELMPYRHQVGGHTTMWRFTKRAVCKQMNNRENEFYEKVEKYHPNLMKFLPRYDTIPSEGTGFSVLERDLLSLGSVLTAIQIYRGPQCHL